MRLAGSLPAPRAPLVPQSSGLRDQVGRSPPDRAVLMAAITGIKSRAHQAQGRNGKPGIQTYNLCFRNKLGSEFEFFKNEP